VSWLEDVAGREPAAADQLQRGAQLVVGSRLTRRPIALDPLNLVAGESNVPGQRLPLRFRADLTKLSDPG
jgi:hypothetical protein